jgi:hypothetical protein
MYSSGCIFVQVNFTQSIKGDCTFFKVESGTILLKIAQFFKLFQLKYHRRYIAHFQVGFTHIIEEDFTLFQVELNTVLLDIAHFFKLV